MASRWQPPQLRLSGIPVLLYHGLTTSRQSEGLSRERRYAISPVQFRAHLTTIHQMGYQVQLLAEEWTGAATFPRGALRVVLTFDDGLASDYQVVFPLLLQAGVRANFFVNTATIGKQGFLNWRQIAEMHREGMSFQSHSHHHVPLIRLSASALKEQLRASKRILEDQLSCPVEFLAAPYGFVNGRVIQIAEQDGYRAVCTSWNWPARPGARTVSRVAIYGQTTVRELCSLLTGAPLRYATRAARTTLLYLPKHLLLHLRPSSLGVRIQEEPA